MRRRVVVTGMGCVTPLGTTVPELWANLQGRQVRRRLHDAVRRQQFPHAHLGRGPQLVARRRRRRPGRVGEARPAHAVRHRRGQAGRGRLGRRRHGRPRPLRRLPRRRRRPAGLLQLQPHDGRRAQERRARPGRVHPGRAQAARPAARAGARAEHAGRLRGHAISAPKGPNFNCLTACAASSQAVGEATEIIRRGEADVMLSGGAHSMIHPFGVTGFNLLTALSRATTTSRKRRRGRSTSTATASSSAKAPRWSCSKSTSAPRSAAPRSTAKSSATAPPPTPSASPTRTPKAAARSPA